jgi:hypothetical protein
MAVTTGSAILFDTFASKAYNGGDIDLVNDTIELALYTSASTPDAAVNEFDVDLTNETTGGSYARATLGTKAWTESPDGTFTYDSADPTISASLGSITARYWALIDVKPGGTAATNQLICYGLLDTTAGGTDVVIADGNDLDIYVNASGWFTLTIT